MENSSEPLHNAEEDYLLMAKDLKQYFMIKIPKAVRTLKIPLKAVDGVDISIKRGEVIGLVGESGCGKTTLGRVLINLITPTEGYLFFNPPKHIIEKVKNNEQLSKGEIKEFSLYHLSKRKMRELRKEMQIVYQDPYSSLDPRYLIKDIITEPLFSFGVKKEEAYNIARNLLIEVGLSEDFMNRYPHQLSGGQRQRVAVARALALNPKFIVLDEPTSALDVSVQAQVLNILRDLKEKHNLTMLFISHHMMVIRHISDRIFVMYLGKIVEIAETEALFSNPLHPYSMALLSAVPIPDPKIKRTRIILEGDVPSPINPPQGCRFHTRCRFAFEKCGWTAEELIESMSLILDSTRNQELLNYPILKDVEIFNDNSFKVNFVEPLKEEHLETIKAVIDKEKKAGSVRQLFGIESVKLDNGGMVVELYKDIKEPPLIEDKEGHFVSCWLYEKGKN
ncbi:MAG: ABC transporter ATP-binding protein [Thermoplasmata archaeon]